MERPEKSYNSRFDKLYNTFDSATDDHTMSNTRKDVDLFDARDKIAAFANKIGGKGSESSTNYKNCNISFNDIPNMVKVNNSFKKLKNYLISFLDNPNQSFYCCLGSSDWMRSLSLLLILSKKMANSLKEGRSVFVHCSDGWDRTSQVNHNNLKGLCTDSDDN
jgi:hypothetical protein